MGNVKFSELNEKETDALIDLFKALGDNTRARILTYLFDVDSVCVSDLASVLGMTTSAVSHQLKILKQNNLIRNKREGKQIKYSLADDHIRLIMEKSIEHIVEAS